MRAGATSRAERRRVVYRPYDNSAAAAAAAAAAANAAIANELYVEHPTSAESSGDSETPAWFADVISMLYNVFEDRFSLEELERAALESGGDMERAIATLL